MTTLREAATIAVQAYDAHEPLAVVMEDLRAALADGDNLSPTEPVQEPVALDWLHKWANQDDGEPETQWHEGYEAARRVVQIHLASPPQRKPLTEEEIKDCEMQAMVNGALPFEQRVFFARAIERAHGIGDSNG